MSRRILLLVPAVALSGSATVLAVPNATAVACAPDRPARAYHPAQLDPGQHPGDNHGQHPARWLVPQPAHPPVACGSTTGFPAGESRIAASQFGVVYSPASYGDRTGVAFTTSAGRHWSATQTNGGVDDNLYADPRTGRIFWITFNPDANNRHNHEIAFSDDGGRHWAVSTTGACCEGGENPRVVAAPPPPGSARPIGYPNVVYACSNTSVFGGVVFPVGARVCSRSMDGGKTFGTPSVLFSKLVAHNQECVPYGGNFFSANHDGAYPQPGPNGSLYVQVHCGTDHIAVTFLAVSRDEGATWQTVPASRCQTGATGPLVIPDALELRVDRVGNLYAAWNRTTKSRSPAMGLDDQPVLQVSRDGGCHWSAPMPVNPPGVVAHSHHPEINYQGSGVDVPYWSEPLQDHSWFMDLAGPGHVAFNFYGTTDRSGRHFDAYVVETRNALARSPVFWAGIVNSPAKNMRDGAYLAESNVGNEHVGLSFAPDGTPWGSFTDGTNGFTGRLRWR